MKEDCEIAIRLGSKALKKVWVCNHLPNLMDASNHAQSNRLAKESLDLFVQHCIIVPILYKLIDGPVGGSKEPVCLAEIHITRNVTKQKKEMLP